MMTVLKYVAKFTELARFTDDYVVTDIDLMVKTSMGMGWMMDRASGMWVLKTRGRRANLLLIAQGKSRGLLLRKGFRDRAADIRAKARVNHPKMGENSRLPDR